MSSTKRKTASILATLLLSLGMSTAAPTIAVWYGNSQSFGQLGNPQTAINILGNVSDQVGIQSLSYKLNGGSSVNLTRGPDGRRLINTGDFNVDIPTSSLLNGANTVLITARNTNSETSTATVNVQYSAGNTWTLPYSIDWNSAGTIPNVSQVVDGHWTLSGGKVRPTFLGYDRLVGIGDKNWSDYEVTVPITIHSMDPAGFLGNSQAPGVGLLFRWTGHTDYPTGQTQPLAGYLPLGAIGWFRWWSVNGPPQIDLTGNNLSNLGSTTIPFSYGSTYWFKMRVETQPGQGGIYRLKVWNATQAEPTLWMLEGQQSLSDPQLGSVCLLSHHIDAEFGAVTVVPASPVPVQLSRFSAQVLSNSLVRLEWTTISETNNYGFEVQKSRGAPDDFHTIPGSFVPGHGTTVEPQHYGWSDPTTEHGTWYYRLKQIDLDGSIHFSDPVQLNVLADVADSEPPSQYALHQNYPNPFNPSTTIRFSVPSESAVTLEVFNPVGQKVATLVDGVKRQGIHEQRFDAAAFPSGVYMYRLTAGGRTLARRMLLMK